jgi:hypothetical protein
MAAPDGAAIFECGENGTSFEHLFLLIAVIESITNIENYNA